MYVLTDDLSKVQKKSAKYISTGEVESTDYDTKRPRLEPSRFMNEVVLKLPPKLKLPPPPSPPVLSLFQCIPPPTSCSDSCQDIISTSSPVTLSDLEVDVGVQKVSNLSTYLSSSPYFHSPVQQTKQSITTSSLVLNKSGQISTPQCSCHCSHIEGRKNSFYLHP
jgi:hypothetical protein